MSKKANHRLKNVQKQQSHIYFDEEENQSDSSSAAPSEKETQEQKRTTSTRTRKPSMKKASQMPWKTARAMGIVGSSSSEEMNELSSDSQFAASDNDDSVLYPKQSFVTCRSPSDSFYLCQLLQDVHEDTKKIRIRWCSLVDGQDDETPIGIKTRFQLTYEDTLDPQAILLSINEVVHQTPTVFSLKKKDLVETKRLLNRSIRSKSISSDEMMDLSTEISPKKNKKHTRHMRFPSTSDEESSMSTSSPDLGVTPGPKKRKIAAKQKKQPAKKRQRKAADRTQAVTETGENLAVELYRCEPFFEDNFPVPFISSLVQSKLAIRAVFKNDPKLLNSLIKDVHRVCSVHVRRSLHVKLTAIHYAIKTNQIAMLKVLLKDLESPKKDRCPFPTVSMGSQSTGQFSMRTFGFRTAPLMASRGAKEGNNALNQDDRDSIDIDSSEEIFMYAIENNCSPEVYDLLFKTFPDTHGTIYNNLHKIIGAGHRRLAAKIIGDIKDNVFHGFNYLHHQVLLNDEEDITINRSVSVLKKTRANDQISPIHCAAINPNAKYLKQLLQLMPEFNLLDHYERRPIHFAAACEGSAPLEYLLSKHVNFNDVDRGGNSPLHIAAKSGRALNVEVLLRKAKENIQPEGMDGDEDNEQTGNEKFGPASIHRLNKSFNNPLHLAVLNNHLDCVKVLLDFEADPNAVTSKTAKLTPLMLACQKGHTDIVVYLLEHGAGLEARDRFKRTPLIHACLCGNSDIVAYLLHKGANPNASDSSLNTALHYAMAYGWYFSVRSLLEAGANLQCANSWQTTCLATGFLKGHYGLCDYLLTEHHADINFQTDDGLTLVMLTVGLELSTSVVQQLDYVVNKHHADCTTTDASGNNAFHRLALNRSAKMTHYDDDESQKESRENLLRVARILLDNHCDPNQLNAKTQSPLMIALENGNSFLVDFFIHQAKVSITADISDDGKTVLHYFAMNSDQYELTEAFVQMPVNDAMKSMGQIFDESGRTALHYCVAKFDEFCRQNESVPSTERLTKKYQSIVRMIEYCLNEIECDPDAKIKCSDKVEQGVERKVDEDEEDEDDDAMSDTSALTTKNSSLTAGQASIFFLLRSAPSINSTMTHPLECLLRRTKNVNVLHEKTQRTPLLEAIHLQQSHTAQLLIRDPLCNLNSASATVADDHHQTPLMLACRTQLFPIVRWLLEQERCDLFAFDDRHNQALHYYLAESTRTKEYLTVLDQFLQRIETTSKAAFNEQGEHQRTPLHIAVYHNDGTIDANTDAEKRLIQYGCDLMATDNQGNLPLHNVFLSKDSSNDRVELCTLLLKAMKYQALDTKNNKGDTPLHLAVAQGATVCVIILQKHGASLTVDNHLSNSIIGTCITSNHLNLFITFLQQTIDVDLSRLYRVPVEKPSAKTIWKWKHSVVNNPLEYTERRLINSIIELDWQGALSMILDDVNRYHLTYFQILEAAITLKKLNLVLRLLSHVNVENLLPKSNAKGQNLFHLLANIDQYDEHLLGEILLCLHEHHRDWNTPDQFGSYPLHYACVRENFVFIDFLREHHPKRLNLSQKDGSGNTPIALLFWSLAHRSTFPSERMRLLITSGEQLDCLCNYDNQSMIDPLSFEYLHAQEEEKPYPSEESKDRTSPLIHAIVHQNFPLVKFLLELHADVNYADEQERTPLMHAIRKNNIHLVKLLLNSSYSLDEDLTAKQAKRLNSKSNGTGFFLGANGSDLDDDEEEAEDEEDDDDDDTEKVTSEKPPSKPFEQTSAVELDATDNVGFSCIHHLVQPFSQGSFRNNLDLLRLLHACGATLNLPDSRGSTPLEYSLKNKCPHLSDELIVLLNHPTPTKKVKLARFSVHDPHNNLFAQADFYHDAEQIIEEYNASHPPIKYNPAFAVNHWSGMTQTGEVILDTDTQQPYDVRLTKIDVTYGTRGLYNFYRMQMIRHKSKKNLYFLFTQWGFIGAGEGQHQLTPFSTLDECRKEFLKIFRAKTGNVWTNIDQFEAKPKKYHLVPTGERQIKKLSKVPIDFEQLHAASIAMPSKLQASSYKDLMRTLLSREAIRGQVHHIALDVDWMPVSQLSRERLQEARDLLQKIKETIEKTEQLTADHLQANTVEHKDQLKALMKEIYEYTNQYYTLVPLNGFADEKLPIIGDSNTLKAQEKLIDDLFELELSYKMLLAAQSNSKRCSPLDYLYQSMRCEFEAMNLADMDSQLILRYIWASAPQVEVEQIFRLAREDENDRFDQCQVNNHCLLWHGTNICNLISILTRGLLVGTIAASSTGSLFGKGIYTADTFVKSLGYCSGVQDEQGERCFMLLCDVALGNVKEITPNDDNDDDKTLGLKTFHSRKGVGRQIPDPKYTITQNYGTQMPLGAIIDNEATQGMYYRLNYNEYIVFDEAQVTLRYLVQFRR